ncbi:MAG: PH domain-containing protein [Corynebacterium casei]|uniref:PH domain-containing protein n=2 Tax=Corynebacterium casei TaxID=160386 RepID=UPI0026494982|nr:PH domain-containing protein [Corynebacterium casei]MDN5730183.1 PH domain-containing protein [Corynebacterium casei]MDN5785076.1 PH domain-containing protein [Corynebacterium casei]MDN6130575.1 PH domain-containing protein [Corynebacterium casei]
MEMSKIAEWTLYQEVPIPDDVNSIMTRGEEALVAYKTLRDSAIFTTKRLIIRDAQGLTGKKTEIYSLPYKSIDMWSTENAGTFDMDAEVELWTRAGHIKIKLNRKIDVRQIDSLIAHCVLGS